MHVPTEMMKGLGSRRQALGWVRIKANGTSNPTDFDGPLAPYVQSCTYSATGIQTVKFTPEFKGVTNPKSSGRVPLVCLPEYVPDAVANNLGIAPIGLWDNTNRQQIVQTLAANNLAAGAAPNSASYIVLFFFHAEIAN